MYSLIFRFLMIVCLFLSLTSCKQRNDSTLQVSGGLLTDDYPYVYAIFSSKSGHDTRMSCSAQFIKPNIALTAAHCITDNPPFIITKEEVYFPTHAVLPKAVNSSFLKLAYDLAILFFREDVSNSTIQVYDGEPLAPGDENLKTVGFGCNPLVLKQVELGSILERAFRTNLLKWVSPLPLQISRLQLKNKDVNSYEVVGKVAEDSKRSKVAVCPGDSGGALILNDKLIGVTSSVTYKGKDRSSWFVSLQHSYTKQLISEALAGEVMHRSDIVVRSGTKDQALMESIRSSDSVASIRASLDFLETNAMAIRSEMDAAFRKALASLKQDEVNDELDDYYPKLAEDLKNLLFKYTKWSPYIFPALLSNSIADKDQAMAGELMYELHAHSASLAWVEHFYGPLPNKLTVGVYGGSGFSVPTKTHAKPFIENITASNDVELLAKIEAFIAGRGGFSNRVALIPLYTLESKRTGSDFLLVVEKIVIKVVYAGKVLGAVTLFPKS